MRAILGKVKRKILNEKPYDEFAPYPDLSPEVRATIKQVRPFTLTTIDRLEAVCSAAEYVAKANIPGSFVECGVWRGGCSMAAALTFARLGRSDIKLYLYDTFTGMTEPTEEDVHFANGKSASDYAKEYQERGEGWCAASLEDVRANIESIGYGNYQLVEGMVEDTIPAVLPDRISLLRLDTDWYESTRHEMIHLFPLLSPGGVLIIDDYGHWVGAKKAIDEYFAEHGVKMLLSRTDYTGRIGIKRAL